MNFYHPDTLEHIRNPLPAVAEWAEATEMPVPSYDVQTQSCHFIDGAWVVETVPCKPNAEIIAELTADLEAYYDSIAQTERYDNRMTCALRAGYVGPFQAQGQSFAIWMDTCNAYAYTVMADCSAGTRDIPTGDELIAELPVSPW